MIAEISIEKLCPELIDEAKVIIDSNYYETSHFDIPLNIDWNTYLSIGNMLVPFILRADDSIVGILFFVISDYPHSKDYVSAQQVTFYIKREYRMYSKDMIMASEQHFTKMGIDIIIQSSRYNTGFSNTLDKNGYERSDIMHIKRLT